MVKYPFTLLLLAWGIIVSAFLCWLQGSLFLNSLFVFPYHTMSNFSFIIPFFSYSPLKKRWVVGRHVLLRVKHFNLCIYATLDAWLYNMNPNGCVDGRSCKPVIKELMLARVTVDAAVRHARI